MAKDNFYECLRHPFQDDPGVSQSQRVMEELLDDSPKIDARKMADLLDYFQQLSRNINYYDSRLNISDWKPFFENSIPFTIASLIKFDTSAAEDKFEFYNAVFDKNPSAAGLQLSINFIFYNAVQRIHNWHIKVKGSELPIERALENVINDKLQQPLKDFICLSNQASNWFSLPRINFSKIAEAGIWNLTAPDLIKSDCEAKSYSKRKGLLALQKKSADLFLSFINAIKLLNARAEASIEQSLIPAKEDFQKKTYPSSRPAVCVS